MTGMPDAPQFSTAEFQPELKDSHALFMRGLLFGIGGALAGLALYATVVIVTNYEIGFVSLAVGWIVGKAVLAGSRGRAGRRYQIAAALLTYFAVSMSTIPVVISHLIRNGDAVEASADSSAPTGGDAAAKGASAGAAATPDTGDAAVEGGQINMSGLLGTLLFIGLASPFLALQDLPGGLISLVILAVGVQIAWKMTGDSRAVVEQAVADPPGEDKPTSLDLNR